MVELSQSQGRYFILDSGPVASPGHCAICGFSGHERKYLDPRLDFEWYGSAIFCEECIASMARLFNFIEPAQALALEARVEEAERELIQLRSVALQIEGLRGIIGVSSSTPYVDATSSASVPDPSEPSAGETLTLPFDGSDGETGSGTQNDPVERPHDLHNAVTGNFDLDFI